MYTITLSDGTKLKKLELNGNNYISPTIIDDSVFAGNLSRVEIDDGKTKTVYMDMVLIQNTTYNDGKSWFVLAEKSPEQREREREREEREAEITSLQMAVVEMYEMVIGGL